MKNHTLPDIIHIILCRDHHVYDMLKLSPRLPNHCYYYLEHDIAEGDSMPDHLRWQGIVEKLKESLHLSTDSEAIELIRKAITISQELRELVDGNDYRLEFIKGLIKL